MGGVQSAISAYQSGGWGSLSSTEKSILKVASIFNQKSYIDYPTHSKLYGAMLLTAGQLAESPVKGQMLDFTLFKAPYLSAKYVTSGYGPAVTSYVAFGGRILGMAGYLFTVGQFIYGTYKNYPTSSEIYEAVK